MLNWGIVGTGDISRRLVADLAAVAPGRIRGVWGRGDRADAFAAEHGIPFCTVERGDLFARDDIDIVYIATLAATHLDIALEALEAGKHVLVEKPMAMSATDTDAIFEKARAVGRFAMEAMWMRFNPLHVDLLERIADGVLGEVGSVRASFGTPFRGSGSKQTPADAGSALRDRGIYPVTLADWVLGGQVSVSASATFMGGVDVAGHAMSEHARGGFAQLAWSGVSFLDLTASIAGDRGWIVVDPMFWAGQSARIHAGSVERIFGSPVQVTHERLGNGYREMLTAVEGAVESGLLEHPWHGRAETVRVADTMDGIVVAARNAR